MIVFLHIVASLLPLPSHVPDSMICAYLCELRAGCSLFIKTLENIHIVHEASELNLNLGNKVSLQKVSSVKELIL